MEGFEPHHLREMNAQAEELEKKWKAMLAQAAEYQRTHPDQKSFNDADFNEIMICADRLFQRMRTVETEYEKLKFGHGNDA